MFHYLLSELSLIVGLVVCLQFEGLLEFKATFEWLLSTDRSHVGCVVPPNRKSSTDLSRHVGPIHMFYPSSCIFIMFSSAYLPKEDLIVDLNLH